MVVSHVLWTTIMPHNIAQSSPNDCQTHAGACMYCIGQSEASWRRKHAPTAIHVPTSQATVALAMPPLSHDIVAGTDGGSLLRLAHAEAIPAQHDTSGLHDAMGGEASERSGLVMQPSH